MLSQEIPVKTLGSEHIGEVLTPTVPATILSGPFSPKHNYGKKNQPQSDEIGIVGAPPDPTTSSYIARKHN